MRPQAGVDRLKPVPPMHANGLPVVGQALSPANRIFSHFLTAGSVSRGEAPERIGHGLAAHPIGVVVLGRLAVDRAQQGKGLGVTLLQDALLRAEQAADTVGIRAVLVQAIDATARSFYLRFGFSPSPVDEMRLMLLMKDLRAFLRTKKL
jgi:GNAT superfamily N-acetyltransferase